MKKLLALIALTATIATAGNFYVTTPHDGSATLLKLKYLYSYSGSTNDLPIIDLQDWPTVTNTASDPISGEPIDDVSRATIAVYDNDTLRAATEDDIALHEQAKAAAAQAAKYAALQAIVNSPAGQTIRELEGVITYFGIPRPVKKANAIAFIDAWQVAKGAEGDTISMIVGNTKSLKLVALFDGLLSVELPNGQKIDEELINAVWTYMVATGQDGD